MSKWIRLLLIVVGLLLLLLVAPLAVLSWASHRAPAFYREAMKVEPEKQAAASERMLQQVAALVSAFQNEGKWEVLIAADQINGWLAVDMLKNHPHALPPMCRDPRVAIDGKRITVASLLEFDGHSSVVSLTVEPYVPKPNVLALRFIKARAGMVPLPLTKILDQISRAARDMQVHLEWRQASGDPVAMLSLPDDPNSKGWRGRLETLRLGDGEIYLAGATLTGNASSDVASKATSDTAKEDIATDVAPSEALPPKTTLPETKTDDATTDDAAVDPVGDAAKDDDTP